jgi:hypothetical protein
MATEARPTGGRAYWGAGLLGGGDAEAVQIFGGIGVGEETARAPRPVGLVEHLDACRPK